MQPLSNNLGALGFYLLPIVVVTSLKPVRTALGRHWWKPIHYTTYAAAAVFFTHGVIADPLLKGRPLDFIDAEKVYVELCALAVLAAIVLARQSPAGGCRRVRARRAYLHASLISNMPRPQLAGDEQAIAGGVVGDPVQHVGAGALGRRQQAGQIDPAGDAAVLRRDARDPLGLPDVGEDLPLHVFELVEPLDRAVRVADRDAPGLLQRRGIDEAQLRASRRS